MYSLIKLRFPQRHTPVNGDEARELSAKALHGQDAEALMYGEKEGMPLVRFIGGRNGMSLLGITERGCEVAGSSAAKIAVSLCQMWGAPVLIESLQTGVCSARPIPYKRRYIIRRLVHQKKPRHPRQPSPDRIRDLIVRSLLRQAAALNLTVPDNIDVCVRGFAEGSPVPIAGGAYAASVRDVVFDTSIDLGGWWGFGYLQSRGYGALNADMPIAIATEKILCARNDAKELADVGI